MALMRQEAEELYANSLESDAANPVLHLFVAQYVRTYRQNNHVENLHLASAAVRDAFMWRCRLPVLLCLQTSHVLCRVCVAWLQAQKPSIDVAYYLFERQKQMEILALASEAIMALQRVQMEDMKTESDVLLLRVKEKQVRA